jgi:hypothetical protein
VCVQTVTETRSVSSIRRRSVASRAERAQQVWTKAAPWLQVKPVTRHWPGRDLADLSPLERKLVGVVRAAVAIGAPGVVVTLADLVEHTGVHRATVCRALERLGECRRRCAGACERPGFARPTRPGEERGKPLCRGCADPCPVDCDRHLALVRRVHEFVGVAWTPEDPTRQGRSRGRCHRERYQRRQGASVFVFGAEGRRRFDATPKSTSTALALNASAERESLRGRAATPVDNRAGEGSVSAVADGRSTTTARAGSDAEAAPEGLGAPPLDELLAWRAERLAALDGTGGPTTTRAGKVTP